jgi:hypothetical protein
MTRKEDAMSTRPTIYLLAEMGREAGCTRQETEQALLRDCPEEAEFIRMVLDELYGTGGATNDSAHG